MSEQKTAKVVETIECKSWNGPKGTIWFHKIKLDNGEVGEVGKKKENAFNPGDSFTYTSEEGQYGLKFKEVFSGGNGFRGGAQQRGSSASFALAYAKDLAVANINKALGPIEMTPLSDKVIEVATKFHNFLKERE